MVRGQPGGVQRLARQAVAARPSFSQARAAGLSLSGLGKACRWDLQQNSGA